jgi:hypothetical protein
MTLDPFFDLDLVIISDNTDRFERELLKGAAGRYPELAETIDRLRRVRTGEHQAPMTAGKPA